MSKSINNLNNDLSQITTYQSGIIQSSAHRVLNRVTTDFLLQYGISSMQWFILGSVYDSGPSGMRISDLMRRVQTTLPYITNTVTLLESKGLVKKIGHTGDSRIKLVSIPASKRKLVEEIEIGLREHLRTTLYDQDHITREELQDYITVIYKIANRG